MFRRKLARVAPRASHLSSTRASFASATVPSTQGIYEFRTYDVAPSLMSDYLKMCDDTAAVRKELNPGFLAFLVTDIGGDVNTITHVYRFENYDARDAIRAKMGADPRWSAFVTASKRLVTSQRSEIFLEASAATKAAGLNANDWLRRAMEPNGTSRAPGVFELRRYQLELGYNPIPKLVELMAQGLPSKMASDTEKKSDLVWMGYSDVGKLNQFVELWRYDTFQDHIRVREAARSAKEWRACVNQIAPMVQMFDTQLMKPADFSPVK
jgi:hypothetical protein